MSLVTNGLFKEKQMKKTSALFLMSIMTSLVCGARDMPISNGRLVNELNANQYSITNLPDSFWVGHEGMTTNAVENISANQITNSVLVGYLAQPSVTNGLDSSTFVPWVTDSDGNKTAVTIGSRSGAVGIRSLLNGSSCKASGQNSHAEGLNTTANSNASHAEGTETIASGFVSHAEGCFTEANAAGSHSDGWGSKASHNSSYVWGGYEGDMPYAEAPSEYYVSHGVGTFNINPVGGLLGFYVGETNMSQHIATATADKITAVDATNLVTSVASKKQDKLTAGAGIEIVQMTNGNYRWSGIVKTDIYDVRDVLYTKEVPGEGSVVSTGAFIDEDCTEKYYIDGFVQHDAVYIEKYIGGSDARLWSTGYGEYYGQVNGEKGVLITNTVIASTISTNGFITANVATNAVKAVVCDVMEYGLTNLAANTETFALASGVIGNLALDSAHTNINLTILYPASTSKSADILLRVINASDTALAINSEDTDVDGTDWTKVKAGTNYVSATRTAYEGGRSKVLVNVKGL